jgi:hypothetical protein
MATKTEQRRYLTPPAIAKRFGVSVKKVIAWIRSGELRAMDLANSGCDRPRYKVPLEALEAFEKSRLVVPEGDEPVVRRVRRRATGDELEQGLLMLKIKETAVGFGLTAARNRIGHADKAFSFAIALPEALYAARNFSAEQMRQQQMPTRIIT